MLRNTKEPKETLGYTKGWNEWVWKIDTHSLDKMINASIFLLLSFRILYDRLFSFSGLKENKKSKT